MKTFSLSALRSRAWRPEAFLRRMKALLGAVAAACLLPPAALADPGDVDTTFNSGTGPNGIVSAIKVRTNDSKIYLGGTFDFFNGTRVNRIARLSRTGALDTSFVTPGVDSTVRVIVTQPDLKCVIGGYFGFVGNTSSPRLARLGDDGALDTAFTTNLGTGADGGVEAMALQSDGKILIGGDFFNFNGVPRVRIARLNADGSLDTTFLPGLGPDQLVRSIKVQADGNILVCGSFSTFNGLPRLGMVRLLPNGSVDTSFNIGTGGTGIFGMTIQPDGKIIVFGSVLSFNNVVCSRIFRINASGSRDLTYAATVNISSDVHGAELMPSGKALIVGVFDTVSGSSRRGVARLDLNGAHDTQFNPGTGAGFLNSGSSAGVTASELDTDGKLLISGAFTQFNNIPYNFLTRVNTADPTPPLIITHPANVFIPTGSNATFSITASGTDPLTYQWRFGGVNLTGATNISITITNAQNANVGLYSIVVANSAGTATSSNASLTLGTFPFFVTPPQSITNVVGANVAFSVTAGGTEPLFYQWVFNGAALPGQTGPTLNLSNIQIANGGPYTIIVSNLFGAVTNSATLTVAAPPAITAGPNGGGPDGQPQSLTVIQGQNATFSANAVGSAPLTYQWRFAGVNISGATNTSITLTNVLLSQAGLYSVVVSNPFGTTTSANATLTVLVPPVITPGPNGGGPDGQPQSLTVIQGQNATFSANAIGTAPLTYQWRFAGVNIPGATGSSVTLANVVLSQAGLYSVVISNPGGTTTSANATLTVLVPPLITPGPNGGGPDGQPQSLTVVQGQNATFSVNATGTAPLAYQWRFAGVNISGATNTTVTLTNVLASQAGLYSVVISNSGGSTTSANATLTVLLPPTIIVQPVSQTLTAGATLNLSVTATGSPTLTYLWRLNGTTIPGATAATLTLLNVQKSLEGNYTVVVSNPYGTVTSAVAVVTIQSPPAIADNGQPQPQTVIQGNTATFSVTATGDAPLSYQWRFGGVNIVGATANPLVLTGVQTNQAGNYSVVVSNPFGSVTSSNALLTVRVPPFIITQPAPATQTVVAGNNASITVVAGGDPTLTYQWLLNGVPVTGATAATLTLNAVQVSQLGNYTVVVSNPYGTVTSAIATLDVKSAPFVATQPQSLTVIQGSLAAFSVTAGGDGPFTYQWRFGGTNIVGATAASFGLASALTNNAGNYSVVITSPYGSVTSSNALLTVRVPPFIITQPLSQSVVAGITVTFTVVAGGDPALTYQWRFNGAAITGATGTTLTLPGVQATQAGDYSVVVTNPYGTATSANATLTVKTAPFVASHPQSLTVLKGTNAAFSVTAGGDGPFTYQWRFAGVNLAGATNNPLSLTNVQTNQAGLYSVVITSPFGSATSSNATLTVLDPPVIIVQPVSVSVLAGDTATFTVVAIGRPTLRYQWCKNGVDIAGATNATLTFTSISTNDVANYCVKVTNSDGSVTSVNAALTISLRALQVVSTQTTNLTAGTAITVPVALLAEGGENRVLGSVAYDANKLVFVSVTTPVAGTLASTNVIGAGQLGFDVTLPSAQTFTAGSNVVVFLNFTVAAGVTQSVASLMLQGVPVTNQVLNASGAPLACSFLSGAVIFKSLTAYALRSQTGATEESLPILNPSGSVGALTFVRISFFDLGADSLGNAIVLINATGTNNGVPFILLPTTLAPAGTFPLNVEYYVSDRVTTPKPRLVVEIVTGGYPAAPAGTLLTPDRTEFHLGRFKIDFTSTAGKTYYIQYSSSAAGPYETSFPGVTGTGGRLQWVDTGPPRTSSLPTATGTRFYRLLQVP
ncbi:MAG: immunoglobulin domain-containing protein [Verrucomicrobia bacterium]|nr:immunoglobulin domain-containing protein [Verrucomicrobiota bacterium]